MSTLLLRNISAIQVIISNYAPKKTANFQNIENEPQDVLPQTLISQNLEDADEIPVTELLHEKSKRSYYFLDNRKIQNKFWRNLIDITTTGPLPHTTENPCWWCRNTFSTNPIGCPLKYNPHKEENTKIDEKFKKAGIKTSTNDFFETEGLFCSFPCCKAFIIDQKSCVKYKESLALLSLLLIKLYGKIVEIPTAPSWKIIKEYGGHLTIEEYRATFGKLEYTLTVNMRRPYMFCSSSYIEESRIKLFSPNKL